MLNLKLVSLFLLSLWVFIPCFCTLPEVADIDPPVVSLVYPYSGSILNGTSNVSVEATDNRKVRKLWYTLDGIAIESASADAASAREVFVLDLVPYADEEQHVMQAFATDEEGNTGTSAQILVTISKTGDIEPPVVEVTHPFSGQNVADSVKVTAEAYDNRIVSEVAFIIDGDSATTDRIYPYEYNWQVGDLENYTSHTVFARAFDGSGNFANSTPVSVIIVPDLDQVPPTAVLLYPLPGQLLSGQVRVQVDAFDDHVLDRVEFYVNGLFRYSVDAGATPSPYSFLWDTRSLAVNSQHSLYYKAIDAAGNQSLNEAILFTIGKNDDLPPTVTLLYPVAGDTLSGTITVTIDATDNIALERVEYYVDGGSAGQPNFTAVAAPWSYVWNTAAWANNKNHTLYIKAYDTAGNFTTQGPVTFFIR